MIYARTGREEVIDSGVQLPLHQTSNVSEPEVTQSLVQLNGSVLDVSSVQHGEDALPHRTEIAEVRQVAVFKQGPSADDHHHGRCVK